VPVPVALILGVFTGVVLTALLVVGMMRKKMVVPERSARNFEETCAAIEKAVPALEGWSFPHDTLDMYAKLEAKGMAPDGVKQISVKQIRVYFVCNPGLAKRVLTDSPQMSAIMPCSWSVYELDDGSVRVSKMNIGMMSKMFSGEVKSAMGDVAVADERFITEVLGR